MEQDTRAAVLNAAERRALADALRIATSSANGDRPGMRAVIVGGGHAVVTDSYVAVTIGALVGLPEGAWDADELAPAAKGAGKDALRLVPVGDTLRAERVTGRYSPLLLDELRDPAQDVPAAFAGGVWTVRQTGATAPNVASIVRDAFAAIGEDEYAPEPAAFDPAKLAAVMRAHPATYQGSPVPASIRTRGLRAAVVVRHTPRGEEPYGVVMPMRTA